MATLKDLVNTILSTTGGNIDVLGKLEIEYIPNFSFINERGNEETITINHNVEYTGFDYFAPAQVAQEPQSVPETTVGTDTDVATTSEVPTETTPVNETPTTDTVATTTTDTDVATTSEVTQA